MENSEHVVFVMLHLGKKTAPSVAQTGFISSSGDQRNKSTPEVYGQTYFTLVVITCRTFASAFGTYRVEPSGPTVTSRGKELTEYAGTVC